MSAPVTYRTPGPGDLAAMAQTATQGFRTYGAFTAPGWQPPGDVSATAVIAEHMALPRAAAVIAEVEGSTAGHVLLIPARESRAPIDDDEAAHVMHVFVREQFWGTGVAAGLLAQLLDAARANGFTYGRLFTPALQARARRFYEREGWALERGPWMEDELGLEVVEYRRSF